MKNRILFLIIVALFIIPKLTFSQCYTVLSVKGEIILEKTGRAIQEMDEICANDKLTFSSSDSKAAVLSSDQGRFIIKPSKKKNADNLTAYVKSVLMQGTGNLSSRGEISLENEFGENYFVVGKYRLQVDLKSYPMDESNFFYLKYQYGGNDINKKLKYENDWLLIDKESVYKIDDKDIEQDKIKTVTLYYYEKEKNTSTKITSFGLAFANENKLGKELGDYINLLKGAGKKNEVIINEVLLYLTDVYGNINSENVRIWLGEKYGLK